HAEYCIVTYSLLLNDPATTAINTLSLHDALPIFAGLEILTPADEMAFHHHATDALVAGRHLAAHILDDLGLPGVVFVAVGMAGIDRKSTRLNSSHVKISYAVFCLKKKKYKTLKFR